MSRPWMPLYIADYLRDTSHLRAIESGAYLHLIMSYWTKGGLPNNDCQLATIAKMTMGEWKRARPTLEEFFAPGFTSHKRIDQELATAAEKYLRRADAGRKGGATTAERRSNATSNASSDEEALRHQPQPQSERKEERDCPKRVRTVYSEEFETRFWSPYPKTPVMSKKQAFTEWKKLSWDDAVTACNAILAYKTWLAANPTHPVVHACRFLSQRRFEGFAVVAPDIPPQVNGHVYVRHESEEWGRYAQRWRDVNHKDVGPPVDKAGGWWFPREAA